MKNLKIHRLTSVLFVAAVWFASLAFAQTETFESIAFRAMQDEMNRNLTNLKLDKLKSPYYISYLITDANLYSVETQLGATVKVSDNPVRNQDVDVMVGSHQRNNLNFMNENMLFGFYGGSFRIPMTLENNYDAVRRSLWVSTDEKYKEAAEVMEAKLSSINQQNIPEEELQLPDFTAIPPLKKIVSSPKITFDKAKIETLTKSLSAVFANYPHLTKSEVNTYIYTADALYLNSEAIQYKVPFSLVCIRINAQAVATDGEPLSDYLNLYFNTPDQIPTADVLKQQVHQLATLLTQLRTAPAIEESYSGPVMFEGEAVGEVVSQCFVDNSNGLLAGRKALSTPVLLQRYGNYVPKENKLERLMDKKVVSRELSVTAIHNQQTYNGTPLVGYYEVDAQGVVPAPKTVLIENGILKALLTNRTPTMRNRQSNGHHVFSISNNSLTGALGAGVIELTSSKTQTYAALKEALIAAAKEEDYEYAYIVRKGVSKPTYMYRISVKDGKEELVRSSKIGDVSLKSFKRIVGVADTQIVYNTLQKGYFGYAVSGTPTSYIVPQAVIFQELEVEKDKDIVLKKEAIVGSPLVAK
jgi:hypothetical protein